MAQTFIFFESWKAAANEKMLLTTSDQLREVAVSKEPTGDELHKWSIVKLRLIWLTVISDDLNVPTMPFKHRR